MTMTKKSDLQFFFVKKKSGFEWCVKKKSASTSTEKNDLLKKSLPDNEMVAPLRAYVHHVRMLLLDRMLGCPSSSNSPGSYKEASEWLVH